MFEEYDFKILQGVDANGRKTELGCLYEATEGSQKSFKLSDGSDAQYLEDGDEIVMWADAGTKSGGVGFGECRGIILPAIP